MRVDVQRLSFARQNDKYCIDAMQRVERFQLLKSADVNKINRANQSLLMNLLAHDYRLIRRIKFKTCLFWSVYVLASYDDSLHSFPKPKSNNKAMT